MKNSTSKVIPSNFTNLWGLAKKLLLAKNPAGRAAMFYAVIGLIMMPVDWLLKFFEQQLYRKSSIAEYPQIFVCGPPRSGTTLVAQVLIKHLPVYYFNNLTSIFPNSPITSNKVFGRLARKGSSAITFKSLYGRTVNMWSPNDALYLWDRWTGVDRDKLPKNISPKNQNKMRRFFAAVEKFSGKPLVNKNNKLNTYANLVAAVLNKAYFICLDRDPVYLAQSQLIASRFIHGDESIPYGVKFDIDQNSLEKESFDPVDQVCNQVLRHKEVMRQQESLIGKDRFIVVPYEDFCAEPAKWVSEISNRVLGRDIDTEALKKNLKPFQISNRRKLEPDIFSRIESNFEKIRVTL